MNNTAVIIGATGAVGNEILKEVSYFVIITRLNLYFHKKRFH